MAGHIDEDSEIIIYQGANLAQLSKIFEIPLDDLKHKLKGNITPCGERHRVPLFSIKEAAAYLVSPPYDIEQFIQKMTVADLPVALRKEFWAGQRARQAFEKENAELWPTDDVESMIVELFNTMRNSLLLSREAVERETKLDKTQRKIITNIIDNTLKEIHDKIADKFQEASAAMATAVPNSDFEGEEDL